MRCSLCLVAAALATGCSAARSNLCFTAHGKGQLHCREPPAEKALLQVYSDAESPQRAQGYYFSKGRLCENKKCRRCLPSNGSSQLVPCGKTPPFAVRDMSANSDLSPQAKAVAFSLALLAVPVVALCLSLKRGGAAKSNGASHDGATAAAAAAAAAPVSGAIAGLLRFAQQPWFPLLAGLATGLNLFTIVFTAATVVIYLAAVLARPKKWAYCAVCNALGTLLATVILLLLVRERGVDYLNQSFPTVLASPAWQRATALMQEYGVPGMLLVSAMPIILHPIIAFGILSNMSNAKILAIVFAGRLVKYATIAWLAANAPGALRFFGIKSSLVKFAAEQTSSGKAD